MFDERFGLRNQNVIAERRQILLIALEFGDAVEMLSGFGKDFDEDGGVDQHVPVFIQKLQCAADHDQIGIGEKSFRIETAFGQWAAADFMSLVKTSQGLPSKWVLMIRTRLTLARP